jgi:hypothetical protein
MEEAHNKKQLPPFLPAAHGTTQQQQQQQWLAANREKLLTCTIMVPIAAVSRFWWSPMHIIIV